jgi:hypothetical protein
MNSSYKKPGKIEVVDDLVAEILKRKTPAERLGIGFEMWLSARRMLLAHLRHIHPEWSLQEVEQEVSRRFLHGTL